MKIVTIIKTKNKDGPEEKKVIYHYTLPTYFKPNAWFMEDVE